ncbi:hypothetical protein DJ017_13325 [Phenylobacterium soli]|uniref:BON domain-containing protein n=2 Tax=Phenylobacterium soli TaxID=2170551 RepID=A0A328AMY5_9CAUL|nr:hypothetical protein DJ017_13325 [Phenylobacterium soli]
MALPTASQLSPLNSRRRTKTAATRRTRGTIRSASLVTRASGFACGVGRASASSTSTGSTGLPSTGLPSTGLSGGGLVIGTTTSSFRRVADVGHPRQADASARRGNRSARRRLSAQNGNGSGRRLMPRFDWRGRDEDRREWREDPRDREDFGQVDYSTDYGYDPDSRTGYRMEERLRTRDDDYGQADYSGDWRYDAERGRPYRRSEEERYADERYRDERYRDERHDRDRHDREGEPRSWLDRAGAALTGRDDDRQVRRRRGPSDRVLWAVIVERLEDARGIDLRDVEVVVEDAEVTLNGHVRRKEDKRRIEDIADIDGVRHVQNNLRVRDRGRWTFL